MGARETHINMAIYLQARHRWVINKVNELLEPEDPTVVEEALRKETNFYQLQSLLKGDGAPTLFFYLHRRFRDGPEGPIELAPQVMVTDGQHEALEGRAVYFTRKGVLNVVKKASEETVSANTPKAAAGRSRSLSTEMKAEEEEFDSQMKPLDLTVADDGEVLFGVIQPNLLEHMEKTMTLFMDPALKEQDEWGTCSSDQRNELLKKFDKFTESLSEAYQTFKAGLELRRPPEVYAPEKVNIKDPPEEVVVLYVGLLDEWCKQTEGFLEESEQSRWTTVDAGPDTELEYWRRRMQRLTALTEQLKAAECQGVVKVLSATTRLSVKLSLDKSLIQALLKRWKMVDASITEAASEAKDNVKYLQTLEKFLEPLYSNSPSAIIDTLPALLNSIKMIYTIARYYNTTERMTGLFMKITNEMIAACKRCVLDGGTSEDLWSQDATKVSRVQ